jgi:hypothetical protein
MELKLRRCTIRDYRPSDAMSLAKHANNRKVWLGLRDAFPHPYTTEDANNFLKGSIPGLPRIHFCIDIGGEAVGGSVCDPVKMFIGALRNLVIGWLKNSGGKAS